MSKRSKMSGSKSRSLFTNTAKQPHPKNIRNAVMRGGYRL